MDYYDYFARHLTKIKRRSGNEYMALCPFHPDKNPSFSFNAETGLWHCFACGEKGNVYQFLEKMGDNSLKIKRRSEMEKENLDREIAKEIDYEYRDLDDNLRYIKKRIEYTDGTKTFRIIWKSDKRELLLYNLPALKRINPDVVYFAEGEKCVHALNEALSEHVDNIAVLGYSQAPDKEFDNSHIEKYLQSKEVYIFADNDEIGEKKAKQILEKLKGLAKKVYIVRFSDKPKGYDIADFLQEGHTIDEALLLASLEYEQHYEDIDIQNLLIEGVPQREFIDEDFKLPRGVLSLVAGLGSVGKGYFLLYLTLKWIQKGLNVCYISAEDDLQEVKRRTLSLIPKVITGKQKGKFRIYELTDEDLLDAIDTVLKEPFDVVIVDPIGFLMDEENANTQVGKVMRKLQVICKQKNINIILSHHLRKYALKEINDKFDMLDAIRGAGSLHNNARYVWFLRRNKEDKRVVEVYNAKNSYAPNDNDFRFIGLFPSDEKLIVEPIGSTSLEEEKKKLKSKKIC